MKKIWDKIVSFFYRLFLYVIIIPVYVKEEVIVASEQSAYIYIDVIPHPKARTLIFFPRREATGLIFHVGTSTKGYETIKVYNMKKDPIKVTKGLQIGSLMCLF
jgi:predicted membrane-bound dolichyl-phosphate-mannose-protein mannosyltransferase